MLWSDPDDKPPAELRTTQAMLRRLGWLLALAVTVSALLASLTPH